MYLTIIRITSFTSSAISYLQYSRIGVVREVREETRVREVRVIIKITEIRMVIIVFIRVVVKVRMVIVCSP